MEDPISNSNFPSGLFCSSFFIQAHVFCTYAFDCFQVTQISKDLTITESRWLAYFKDETKNMEDGNANAKRRKHYLRSGLSGTVMIGFEDGSDSFGVLSVYSSARLTIPVTASTSQRKLGTIKYGVQVPTLPQVPYGVP